MNDLRIVKIFSNSLVRSIALIAIVTLVLGFWSTLFQVLDLRYRIAHNDELQYVTSHWEDASGSGTSYAYHPTPYDLPAKGFFIAFALLPAILAIAMSLAAACTGSGSTVARLRRGLIVSLAVLPLFAITNLPWAIYYWQPDTDIWQVGWILVFGFSALVILLSTLLNTLVLSVAARRTRLVEPPR